MDKVEYKVPRLLWENLESVLLAQSKRYIAELANRLGVPEKELLKKVLPTSDSLKLTLFDSCAESNQCKAYIQQNELTIFCKKPVAYQSEYCSEHRLTRMHVFDGINPHQIQKIKDINTLPPVWIMNNTIINSNGNTIGKLKKSENKMTIFVVEE